MEYFKAFGTYIAEFSYGGQIIIFVCGMLTGYLLRIIVFKLHLKRWRLKHERRNIVLIEQKGRKKRIKKTGSAEYFDFIKTAQYSQAAEAADKNNELGVSARERE